MKHLKYNFLAQTFTASGMQEIVKGCNGLTFINNGGCAVVVNGITLLPGTVGSQTGDSFAIGGNLGEVLSEKRLNIAFTVGGANPSVMIVQKFYTEITD